MLRFIVTASLLALPHAALADDDALVLAGEAHAYRPAIRLNKLGFRLRAPISARLTGTQVGSFPADFSGVKQDPELALDTQIRVGAILDTGANFSPLFVHFEYEHDIFAGIFTGGDPTLDAIDPPLAQQTDHTLRKGFGRVTFGPLLTVAGGLMTSHWGLGLLANDGAHGWTPKSAYFSDPRGGDRVLRGQVTTGPWTRHKILLTAGYDKVQGDDVLVEDDTARQAIAAAIIGYKQPTQVGMYAAFRTQETSDGETTDVAAFDVHAKWRGSFSESIRYTAEIEAAYIQGTTELGPSVVHPTHDVQQIGAAGRFGLDAGALGGVLDVIYATGDRNLDDGVQNSFRADRNFELGLLLFRHLLAAQTARAPITAADPNVVGQPADNLERIPSRGAVTSTAAVFPRMWWRPSAGLEIYGGPLLAISEVEILDPRRTRQAGGNPRNALDGDPGRYLGTELDLGVRFQSVVYGTELSAGLEGALLLPGSAFQDAGGETMDPMMGGRFMLAWRL